MAAKRTIRTIPQDRTPVREQHAHERIGDFDEVSLGYDEAEAAREAERCLFCADPPCISGCPVAVDIPGFIRKLSDQNLRAAYDIITRTNLLPAVCGRVCPQENQCEGVCTVGDTLQPVAIGRLERFVGDPAIQKAGSASRTSRPPPSASASSARARPAWPARPTWPRPAATSRSSRRSTSPAACCATASPTSACPTRSSTPRSRS